MELTQTLKQRTFSQKDFFPCQRQHFQNYLFIYFLIHLQGYLVVSSALALLLQAIIHVKTSAFSFCKSKSCVCIIVSISTCACPNFVSPVFCRGHFFTFSFMLNVIFDLFSYTQSHFLFSVPYLTVLTPSLMLDPNTLLLLWLLLPSRPD